MELQGMSGEKGRRPLGDRIREEGGKHRRHRCRGCIQLILNQQLDKNAQSGSIQSRTGNRERSLESMHRKEAWGKEMQGVKLFQNIHHA